MQLSSFELKNVKTFKGMEGEGFNAALYVDGKYLGTAIDDASGGQITVQWNVPCNDWEGPEPIKKFLQSKEAMDLAIKNRKVLEEQYGFKVKEKITSLSLEELIEGLFNEHMWKKDLARISKRHGFVFTTKAKPREFGYFRVSKGYVWTKEEVDEAIADLKAEHGENLIILNNPVE